MKIAIILTCLAVVVFMVKGANMAFDIESWIEDVNSLQAYNFIDELTLAWELVEDSTNEDPLYKLLYLPIAKIGVTFSVIGEWFNWVASTTDLFLPWKYIKPFEIENIWG